MGIVTSGKKLILGGKEAFNSFMYNGNTLEKKNAKISLKKEELNKKAEAQKQEKTEKRAQREEKSSFLSRIFTRREEELEEGQILLFESYKDEDGIMSYSQYVCQMIELSQLLDDSYNAYERPLKGQDLLKRDLNTSKLYIAENIDNKKNGDIYRVNRISEVEPEDDDKEHVYLLLETQREYYAVKFSVKRSF